MTKEEEIILDKDCFLHNHKWYYENDVVIKCMQEYSDQQNKELKEIVIQLQKDFVLKLNEMSEQNDIEFYNYLKSLPEQIYNSHTIEELYFGYKQSKQ